MRRAAKPCLSAASLLSLPATPSIDSPPHIPHVPFVLAVPWPIGRANAPAARGLGYRARMRIAAAATVPHAVAGVDAHAAWSAAHAAIERRDWPAAERALADVLARQPRLVPAHLSLAAVSLAGGRLRRAARHTRHAATVLDRDAGQTWKVATALARLGETNAARACLERPEAVACSDPPLLLALAHVHQGLGLPAQALALMERARALGLDGADFRYFHALQLQFNGRLEAARAQLQACLRMGPTYGRAWLSLARLRRRGAQDDGDDFLAALNARLREVAPGSEDAASLRFAQYEEHERRGEHAQAWDALVHANAAMRARQPYDAIAEERLFARLAACFPADAPAGDASPQPQPIFVVGMPRSGTTLLERILGRHPMVAAAGELPDLPRQLRWTADRHGHALLDETLLEATPTLDFARLGRRYLAQTAWRARGRPLYIDKLPPNFMLLAHVRRALPGAKVVHLRREPVALCFSNFRAMFGDAYAYSYGLDTLAHHHRLYAGLMAHWHRTMPGFVHDVAYEALVRDPEATCRALCAHLDLPFDSACLDPARDAGAVATLSSAQVREPVHARGIDAWRRYAAQLDPLRAALQAAAPMRSAPCSAELAGRSRPFDMDRIR